VPLLDLAALLGLRKGRARDKLAERLVDSHVVLVRMPELIGLRVDRVAEVTETAADGNSVPLRDGEQALVLDPAHLVGPNRRKMLFRILPSANGEAP
jgi:chemotaxis signal transduction protein